jgi:hypothetical protein
MNEWQREIFRKENERDRRITDYCRKMVSDGEIIEYDGADVYEISSNFEVSDMDIAKNVRKHFKLPLKKIEVIKNLPIKDIEWCQVTKRQYRAVTGFCEFDLIETNKGKWMVRFQSSYSREKTQYETDTLEDSKTIAGIIWKTEIRRFLEKILV